MGVKWTKEQAEVIELRNCNILVSAAAGSGKTAVLVARILSMLTDVRHPVDIDRLLIVTFTNAAAAEMKDRIRMAIEQKIEELEKDAQVQEKLLVHLQRQTSLLANAQITTIHSFCQHVIRNHFHTIDLDPSMRIADEGEQKLLQNDVLKDLIEERYALNAESFLHMTECLAPGRDDGALTDIILSLYRFSQSFPWPQEWLEKCRDIYSVSTGEELDRADWTKTIAEFTDRMLSDAAQRIEQALELALCEDGPWYYEEPLRSDLDIIEKLMQKKTWSEKSRAFAQREAWMRLPAKKDESVSENKKEQVKAVREDYKKIVSDLADSFYYTSPEEAAARIGECAPVIRELTDLTEEFARRYQEEKQKKNLCDFNDLEHFALKILIEKDGETQSRTQVAKDLAARFEEVMIDEYQDSNYVQEMILRSVSGMEDGRYNMFMVGDVKQSIYRFRLARPELFMEKYRIYSLTDGNCRRIDLHKNFRSRSEVLDGINLLFEQIMEHQLGNVEYDEAAALYAGAQFPPGDDAGFRNTEVLMLDASSADNGAGESDREMEARMTAGRIREIVGREIVWDKEKGAYRPAGYGDIVILLRTVQGWAEVFHKVLTDMDIPAYTGSRTGYFSTVEIQTVLSLLRLIDNPLQDIPMAAVLRSPIVGLSGEEMADIRSRHPQMPFCRACMEDETLTGFFEMLDGLRKMAEDAPVHELLMYILDCTGYANYAAAMPGGSQRKANLDMLVEKAVVYEKGSYRGLYNFVRYIENLHKYDVDYGEANTGAEENAVRIMSIHKSKGLEFPVVFVCGMGKVLNQSDVRSSVVFHSEFGIGCDAIDPVRRIKRDTLLKNLMKRDILQENMGEEIRVLYVALTRAKEKLILTGSVSGIEQKLARWAGICRRKETALPFSDRLGASTYWDLVIPALMRNRCFEQILDTFELSYDRHHPLYAREAFMEVRITSPEELTGKETQRQAEYLYTKARLLDFPVHQTVDEDAAKRLRTNLSFSYPYAEDAAIPGKVSVSELKKTAYEAQEEDPLMLYEEQTPVPLIPEFMQQEHEVTGAARGTIYHRFMECADFALTGKKPLEDDIKALLEKEKERMVRQGYLTEEEACILDMHKLEAFFTGPLAKRMAEAASQEKLFRERQFVLEVPADSIHSGWNSQQKVLIQGIIDAYFIEEGEIVLLDYKTDYVKLKEASSLWQKYGVQLEYYKKALERLTHLPVKEKLIYSFCLDRIVTDEEQGV